MISAIRLLALVLLSFVIASAQGSKPKPSPTPTPEPKAEDQVRVFIEEVRLPVAATDTYGHYDPTLRTDDILVLEDGVTQQIRSIQQLPVNVLLLLDTGNQLGLKNTNTTRDIALRVVSDLRAGNRIAVMQFTDRPELHARIAGITHAALDIDCRLDLVAGMDILQQFRHMCRRGSKESDAHPRIFLFCFASPFDFMFVIDERT